jgi:hypothetical protein
VAACDVFANGRLWVFGDSLQACDARKLFELVGYFGRISLDLCQPANERVGLRRARLRGPPALQQSHVRNK